MIVVIEIRADALAVALIQELRNGKADCRTAVNFLVIACAGQQRFKLLVVELNRNTVIDAAQAGILDRRGVRNIADDVDELFKALAVHHNIPVNLLIQCSADRIFQSIKPVIDEAVFGGHELALMRDLELQRDAHAKFLFSDRVKMQQHHCGFAVGMLRIVRVKDKQDRIDVVVRDAGHGCLHGLKLGIVLHELIIAEQCDTAEYEQGNQNREHKRDRSCAGLLPPPEKIL